MQLQYLHITKFLFTDIKELPAKNHSRITLDQADLMYGAWKRAAGTTEQHLIIFAWQQNA